MMILLIIVILSFLLFGVDFAFYLKNRYCRFHIGRMPYEKWRNAVYVRAQKWRKHTPAVKITDNSRYILLDMIGNHYINPAVQSFQKAALFLGLEDMGQSGFVDQFIRNGKWISFVDRTDIAMLAYALMRDSNQPDRLRPAMDEVYGTLTKAMDAEGLISYTGNPCDPHRYVDALGMVCPFLARYGKVYNNDKATKAAFSQLEYFHSCGLLLGSALPNHAINKKTKLPCGVYGWGRGTAWYVIGLMDTFNEIDDMLFKSKIKEWIEDAANCYMRFQRDDGGFGYILQMDNGFDSSVTAVMAWFYLECTTLFGNSTYKAVAEKALEKLRKVTRINGAIDWSQGDTKAIGVFSQVFDVMPFTQGFALRAISLKEQESCGEKEKQD